jgi:hypothetical protein
MLIRGAGNIKNKTQKGERRGKVSIFIFNIKIHFLENNAELLKL